MGIKLGALKYLKYAKLIVWLTISTALPAPGAEPTIKETDTGYVVEYTGTPDSKSNPDTRSNLETQRSELSAELDRLKAESEEIRKRRDAARDNVNTLKKRFAEDNERFRQKYEPRK